LEVVAVGVNVEEGDGLNIHPVILETVIFMYIMLQPVFGERV